MKKEIEIEIYFNDLTELKRQEILAAGYDDANVTNSTFPLTTIFIEIEQEGE